MRTLVLLFCLVFLPFVFGSTTKPGKQYIDITKIKRVSYLLASGRGFGQSSFGHSYLRFSYDEHKFSKDDITIEFIADVPPHEISYLRGIGIGENYDLAVVSSSYKNVYRYHVLGEDRDLTSYVLNLSDENLKSISSKVNELIQNGSGMTYSFFIRNCAAMVSEVFADSFEMTFNGPNSVVPIFIPHKLKKKGMIKDIHLDPRVTTLREQVAKKKLEGIATDETPLINIEKQLASENFGERIHGLYKLQAYREDNYDNRKLDIKLGSLGRNIVRYESTLVKNYMRPYFSAKRDFFTVIPVKDIEVSSSIKGIRKTKLAVRGENVYARAELRAFPRHHKDNSQKRFPVAMQIMPGFKYRNGVIYNPKGEVFTYRLTTDVLDKDFHHPGIYINSELIKTRSGKKVHFTLLKENDFDPKKKNYTTDDLLAVDNGDGTGRGYCYAHTELTRLMKTQVIFNPEAEPLSKEKSLALVKELYKGKIIVIPGFSTINEFTRYLGREDLGKLLNQRQADEYTFMDFAKAWFSDTRIKAKNFYILQNLIEVGHNPVITFEVEGKSNIGHALIVTKIEKSDRGYELEVIDPNKLNKKDEQHGFVKGVHWFNTETGRLHTFTYGNVKVYIPKQDIRQYELISLIMNNKQARKTAVDTSNILGNYALRLIDLFK